MSFVKQAGLMLAKKDRARGRQKQGKPSRFEPFDCVLGWLWFVVL